MNSRSLRRRPALYSEKDVDGSVSGADKKKTRQHILAEILKIARDVATKLQASQTQKAVISRISELLEELPPTEAPAGSLTELALSALLELLITLDATERIPDQALYEVNQSVRELITAVQADYPDIDTTDASARLSAVDLSALNE